MASDSGAQRYRLEATPTYCYGGRPVITALQETLPDVRIIITLRDPVQRLWASFGYMKSKGLLVEMLTFEQYPRDRRRLERIFEPYNQPLATLLAAHGYPAPAWLRPEQAMA